MRKYIPEGQIIVCLDTSVPRQLCFGTPSWVPVFQQMKKRHVHFSIADAAMLELLVGYDTGRITQKQFSAIASVLDTFVSPILPILPGKKQLVFLIDEDKAENSEGFPNESMTSCGQWEYFKNYSGRENSPPMIFVSERGDFQIGYKGGAVASLRFEQRKWSGHFERGKKAVEKALKRNVTKAEIDRVRWREIDSDCKCVPPLSARLDLHLKNHIRYLSEYLKRGTPYNPISTTASKNWLTL